jgi:hypothetical protein
MEHIARRLEAAEAGIEVFTYSASSHLDWSVADRLTVNRSDGTADFGDRRYIAVDGPADIPDDALWCPFDRQRAHGVPQDERSKCGDCRLCLTDDAPDVGVTK